MHEEEAFIHMKLDEEHFTVGVDNRINFLIPREAFLKLYSEDKEKLLDLIILSIRKDIEKKISKMVENIEQH